LSRLASEARLRLAKHYLHERDYPAGMRHAKALVGSTP
jgi:hypothetical protein